MWRRGEVLGRALGLEEPGSKDEELGSKDFQGEKEDEVKINVNAGTGDWQDDYYVDDLDPKYGQRKLAVYVVTYSSMRKGKTVDQLQPHAIVFEEWQEIDGLKVPKTAAYYAWKNETIEGEALGRMHFNNVKFSTAAPDESRFMKPSDAVVAPKP